MIGYRPILNDHGVITYVPAEFDAIMAEERGPSLLCAICRRLLFVLIRALRGSNPKERR